MPKSGRTGRIRNKAELMTRRELVNCILREVGKTIERQDVERIINALPAVIKRKLEESGSVSIPGVVKITMETTRRRSYRDPRDPANVIIVEAHSVIKARASGKLR